MEALSERPILLRYTLDEYATARKSTIVRGFIDALTRYFSWKIQILQKLILGELGAKSR